jgi:PhnB protein
MGARLNPYLGFDGDARQAMEFSRDGFGGTLTVSTYSEFGAGSPEDADKVMHSLLETDRGFTLMAADVPAEGEQRPGSKIVLGDEFSMCVDRFGISWMVNISQPA